MVVVEQGLRTDSPQGDELHLAPNLPKGQTWKRSTPRSPSLNKPPKEAQAWRLRGSNNEATIKKAVKFLARGFGH
jgi:hypothetical protein